MHVIFSRCDILSQIYLKHNSLGDEVPIVVVLKAMGMECDQEIVQLIGFEEDIVELLSPSLEEPYNLGIFSRDQVKTQAAIIHSIGWWIEFVIVPVATL